MHVKHLGTDQYFYASVLTYLVNDVMESMPDDNLALLWDQIVDVYKDTAQYSVSIVHALA